MVKKKAQQELAKNAQSAIKGLLAVCDTHTKISKHLNDDLNADLEKQREEAELGVTDTKIAIDAI